MTLYFVRHAKAGKRGRGPANDLDRPLDDRGAEQARAVIQLIGHEPIEAIYSSPALRCVQTVEPLADKLGLEVIATDSLLEGQSADAAVTHARELARSRTVAALCSHGDIIPDAIQTLAREGMAIIGPRAWAKGSTWQLNVRGGDIVSARFLGPF